MAWRTDKESTPEAIKALHEQHIRIVMLTGDSKTTAQAVARKLNIDDVIAEGFRTKRFRS